MSTTYPKSYQEAKAMLRKRHGITRIGNNTVLAESATDIKDQHIAVALHGTPIVTFYPDGRIVLFSGGYRTVTTKRRMNQCLPKHIIVFQEGGEWFVSIDSDAKSNGDMLRFHEGMTLPALETAT